MEDDFDTNAAQAEIAEGLFGDAAVAEAPAGDDQPGDVKLEVEVPAAAAAPEPSPAPEGGDPAASPEPAPAPAPEAKPAPRTWRAEAAAKWATVDPEVQAEILKREEDIFKGLEGYKADAEVGRGFQRAIQPYTQMLQAAGIHPVQAAQHLMASHHALSTAAPEQKLAMFQKLAQDYGVDLGALSGEPAYVDPQVAALQKQLGDLQSRLTGRERQEAESARASLQREIDTFAADPAHAYFDEVASDIAALLRSGAAKDLGEAYDKAVWANPVTRAKEQSRLAAESAARARAEATAKAEQARKAASANVKAKPKAASATAPLGSIDDTLNAALSALRSRA